MRLKAGAVVVIALGLPSVIAGATSTLLSRSATDLCGDISGELVVPGPFDKKIPIGYVGECQPLFLAYVNLSPRTSSRQVRLPVSDLRAAEDGPAIH